MVCTGCMEEQTFIGINIRVCMKDYREEGSKQERKGRRQRKDMQF